MEVSLLKFHGHGEQQETTSVNINTKGNKTYQLPIPLSEKVAYFNDSTFMEIRIQIATATATTARLNMV